MRWKSKIILYQQYDTDSPALALRCDAVPRTMLTLAEYSDIWERVL